MLSYEKNDFNHLRHNLFLNNSTSFSPTNSNKNIVFFPTETKEENKKNIILKGIHKSASITFYSKKLGYLLCKEIRDNKLVYHPIGGKYEDKDEYIEFTAIREFIEETGILQNNEFKELLENNDTNSKDLLYNIIKNEEITIFYDFYVNKEKEYLHRYYVINIEKVDENLMKIIKNLDIFYENTFKEISNNGEYIISLNWDKDILKKNINKNNYSMLTIYLSNLLKKK